MYVLILLLVPLLFRQYCTWFYITHFDSVYALMIMLLLVLPLLFLLLILVLLMMLQIMRKNGSVVGTASKNFHYHADVKTKDSRIAVKVISIAHL